MKIETILRAARKASDLAYEADWSQFQTFKLDDGTQRVKETAKQLDARTRFAARKRRQSRRLWDALWRKIYG